MFKKMAINPETTHTSTLLVLQISASVTALASWDIQTRLARSVEVQPMLPQNCSPERNTGQRWMFGPCKTTFPFNKYIKKSIYFMSAQRAKCVFWSSSGVNMYAMLTGTLPFTVEPFSLRALHQKMVDKEMNPLPPSLSTGKYSC